MFCKGECPIQHKRTIGVAFKEKSFSIDETCEQVNVMLHEIGGKHIDAPIYNHYFKEVNAVILMFATDSRESFDLVEKLFEKVRAECSPETLFVLVQNKIDLLDCAAMKNDEAEQLARDLRTKLCRLSCKDRAIVRQVFEHIINKASNKAVALTDIVDVQPIFEESPRKQEEEDDEEEESLEEETKDEEYDQKEIPSPRKNIKRGKKKRSSCVLL